MAPYKAEKIIERMGGGSEMLIPEKRGDGFQTIFLIYFLNFNDTLPETINSFSSSLSRAFLGDWLDHRFNS